MLFSIGFIRFTGPKVREKTENPCSAAPSVWFDHYYARKNVVSFHPDIISLTNSANGANPIFRNIFKECSGGDS
jgi:hypothetical protein